MSDQAAVTELINELSRAKASLVLCEQHVIGVSAARDAANGVVNRYGKRHADQERELAVMRSRRRVERYAARELIMALRGGGPWADQIRALDELVREGASSPGGP